MSHIHIIGIAGVGTSALAVALHNSGYKVTGSDKGFFPPVSTLLKSTGVPFYAGWHPEQMGTPDLIVAGGSGTSESNPEFQYAKEKNIPVISFAEAVGKFIVKEQSVVCVGTWGKTTTSALIAFILERAGFSPSFFIGGVPVSFPSGKISKGNLSVVEGDEYKAAIWDKKPKFAYYRPTHLLLTSVSWDHADLYPTEDAYFDAFNSLLSSIPENGSVVANIDDPGVKEILRGKNLRLTTYGKTAEAVYRLENITHTGKGIEFDIVHDLKKYSIKSPMLGDYNAENITASFAMCSELGVAPEVIIDSIKDFSGLKRRLEKRYEGKLTVIDAHAPTPEKASSNLKTLKEIFNGHIIAIFEPNIGGRKLESAHQYDNAFRNADSVLIPRLSKLKTDASASTQPIDGQELARIMSKTHGDVRYIENDDELVSTAIQSAAPGDVIVFLGSHGFRGMIEDLISKFS